MRLKEMITYHVGDEEILMAMDRQTPFPIFDERILEFLSDWSSVIRALPSEKKSSDISTFGFWCRKPHLHAMKNEYQAQGNRMGRGLSLHFAPSNIPTLFAYSLTAGLLAGTPVLLRLPGKLQPAALTLLDTLKQTLMFHPEIRKRACLIQYDHDKTITDTLSARCGARVIWGGDESVAAIQKSPLPADAVDITFPDRKSLAILSAAAVLDLNDTEELIRNFYNDTYLTDQNACSAPNLIYWVGGKQQIQTARTRFLDALDQYLTGRYTVAPELAVKKWETALCAAATLPVSHIDQRQSRVILPELSSLTPQIWELTAPGGYFYEYQSEDLSDLASCLTDRCQTITCFGVDIEKLSRQIIPCQKKNRCRIVPIGQALAFSLYWDGKDLIQEMSLPFF